MRGDAQVRELHLAGVGVDEDVLGLDVLVDDVVVVELGERPGDAERQGEEAADRQGPVQDMGERDGARVFQDEARLPVEGIQSEGLHHGGRVEAPAKGELPPLALELVGAGAPGAEHLEDDRQALRAPESPVESAALPLMEGFRDVVGSSPHLVRLQVEAPWDYTAERRVMPWCSAARVSDPGAGRFECRKGCKAVCFAGGLPRASSQACSGGASSWGGGALCTWSAFLAASSPARMRARSRFGEKSSESPNSCSDWMMVMG